jgi:hypothetical protein
VRTQAHPHLSLTRQQKKEQELKEHGTGFTSFSEASMELVAV